MIDYIAHLTTASVTFQANSIEDAAWSAAHIAKDYNETLMNVTMSKAYYPNNWDEYHDMPDDFFQQHTFEEVMDWRVGCWELPSSVCCLIRARNRKTGKVTERFYSRKSAAHTHILKLIAEGNEVTVCDHTAIGTVVGDNDEDN